MIFRLHSAPRGSIISRYANAAEVTMFFRVLISILIGYCLGSFAAAPFFSRIFYGEDVRAFGSGNPGATNAARVYGPLFGILTFALDFTKGILACWLGRLIGAEAGLALSGLAAVFGHCFPVFFRFKGGKGVSVGAAFALMIDWRIFVAAFMLFLILAAVTRIISLGSVAGTAVVGILSLLIPDKAVLRVCGLIEALLVIFMHRSNIIRLFNEEERPLTFGSRRVR